MAKTSLPSDPHPVDQPDQGDLGPAVMLALAVAAVQQTLTPPGVDIFAWTVAIGCGLATLAAWRLAPAAVLRLPLERLSPAAADRALRQLALVSMGALALLPLVWQAASAALAPGAGSLWSICGSFLCDLANPDSADRSWLPLELTLLAMLRNIGFGLAWLAAWRRYAGLAAFVSLLMALCAMAAATDRAVVVVLALYAAAACSWLAARHWRQLQPPAPALPTTTAHHERLPGAPVVVVTAAVVAAVSLAWFMPRRTLAVWSGLLASSGGTAVTRSSARDGIGSGDKLVGARDVAQSIGFVETEVYLESEQSSLYDVYNEIYGKPPSSRERQEALSLAAETNEQNQLPSEHMQAEEEFSAVREPLASGRKPPDKAADALVYVAGRTPVHLRLALYDRFDGARWQPAPPDRLAWVVRDRSWISCETPATARAACGATEQHRIKIALLATDRLPAPASLTAFRLGRLDQLRFYSLAVGDLPQLATRKIPPGETLETETAPIDPARLEDLTWSKDYAAAFRPGYREVFADLDPAVIQLARKWTAGLPRGWPQIAAIVAGLRNTARLDDSALAPADCRDVVGHFLRAKAGPDYLFATTAAVMLRALDYPTRLVGGFYAAPEDYDPQTGHTPVRDENAHLWLEVGLPGLGWVTVEPTPGFETLLPATPWHTVAYQWLAAWFAELAARPTMTALTVVLVLAGFRFRRVWADAALTAWWRASLTLHPDAAVVATLRLLERRARWAGCARPRCRTFRQWAFAVTPASTELDAFARAVEACLYGRVSPEDPTAACRAIVPEWSLRRLVARTQAAGSRA